MATKYNMVELGVVDALGNLNVMYPITPSDAIACADGTLTKVLSDNKSSISTLRTNLSNLSNTVSANKTSADGSINIINNNINTLTNRCAALETNMKNTLYKQINVLTFVSVIDISETTTTGDEYVFQVNANYTGGNFDETPYVPYATVTVNGHNPSGNQNCALSFQFSLLFNRSATITDAIQYKNFPSENIKKINVIADKNGSGISFNIYYPRTVVESMGASTFIASLQGTISSIIVM